MGLLKMAKNLYAPEISTVKAEEALVHGAIDLEGVEGRVNNSLVKKVGELVVKHSSESLSIIRDWMSLKP